MKKAMRRPLYLTAWKDRTMLPGGFVLDLDKRHVTDGYEELLRALLSSLGIVWSFDTKPRRFKPQDGYFEVEQ